MIWLALLKSYWKPLAGAAMALALIFAVLMYGSSKYNEGVRDERAKQAVQAIAAAKDRGAVDDAVSSLPDGSALDELRKHWARD